MIKHIGIVASSSEGASLCYRTICLEAAKYLGEHNHPEITMSSIPLAEHLKLIKTNDWIGLAKSMAYAANKTAYAGADFAICPDNTNHLAFHHLSKFTNVPFIHIAEAVISETYQKKYRKIGLLGTKYLMEGTVYQEYIDQYNLECAIPNETDRTIINKIIFEELVKGEITKESELLLLDIINKLGDKNCEAIILGCTELPLIINSTNSPIDVLDSTRLLAMAALKKAINKTSHNSSSNLSSNV